MERAFSAFARFVADHLGRSYSFVIACLIIAVWAASGPVFQYSDTWQLIINTGTTIITWLMVFLLQHTQNRDTAELKIQIAELIRANQQARNQVISLDDLSHEDLVRLPGRVRGPGQGRYQPSDVDHRQGEAARRSQGEVGATSTCLMLPPRRDRGVATV
jgi:low affinity Fe/Cu permease